MIFTFSAEYNLLEGPSHPQGRATALMNGPWGGNSPVVWWSHRKLGLLGYVDVVSAPWQLYLIVR